MYRCKQPGEPAGNQSVTSNLHTSASATTRCHSDCHVRYHCHIDRVHSRAGGDTELSTCLMQTLPHACPATTRAAERMAVSRCALCLAGAADGGPVSRGADDDGERRRVHHLGASRSVVVERASAAEGAGGRGHESTRVADREEQTQREASGYAHAQGTDALKADAQDGSAVLTDDLRAWHAMCVVVLAQELPHSARCMTGKGIPR